MISKLVLKLRILPGRGIEADVIFEDGEVNQIAVQREGWHLIFDCFLSAGCSFPNRSP